MSIAIGKSGLMSCASIVEFDRDLSGAQTIEPGHVLRLSSTGAIMRGTEISSEGGVIVHRTGIYTLTVQIAPNSKSELMRYVIKIDDTELIPSSGSMMWTFIVVSITSGQKITIINAGVSAYVLDGPIGSLFVDIVTR